MRAPRLAAVLLFAPLLSGAQAVRGRVVGADSAVVPGAIVTLLDSAGVPLARALADDEGRFAMRTPAPGSYRFHVRRLGYMPFADSLVRVPAGAVLERTVVLSGAPVSLQAVRVTGDQQCLGPDSTAAAFLVWEEARTALTASQLTRATRAYQIDVELFTNRQGSDARERPTIDRRLQRLSFIRAFNTLPPDVLARDGYLARASSGDVYYAPDENALLSDAFAESHCMKLLPDSGSADRVRLGFTPLPGRRVPDIRGVLSIDRATSELRDLEYQYVNLRPHEMVGSPGGTIAWRRLPEGSWIVEYWAIGLPVHEVRVNRDEQRPVVGRNVRQAPPRDPMRIEGKGRVTTGGGVARVAFGDTILWMGEVPIEPRIRVPLPPD